VIDGEGMIRNDYGESDSSSLNVESISAAINHLLTPSKKP